MKLYPEETVKDIRDRNTVYTLFAPIYFTGMPKHSEKLSLQRTEEVVELRFIEEIRSKILMFSFSKSTNFIWSPPYMRYTI